MWKPFVYENVNYLIKLELASTNRICLTNLQTLWTVEITPEQLQENFKSINSLFNGTVEEILEECTKILSNPESIQSLSEIESKCIVLFKTKTSELPLKLELELIQVEPNILFNEVTLPLIKTIQYLELKMNKHAELLKKKDREIEEYNLQFEKITASHLITEKFEKDPDHMVDGLLLNVFTKSDTFHEMLSKAHGNVEEDFPELKKQKVERRKLSLPRKMKRR